MRYMGHDLDVTRDGIGWTISVDGRPVGAEWTGSTNGLTARDALATGKQLVREIVFEDRQRAKAWD